MEGDLLSETPTGPTCLIWACLIRKGLLTGVGLQRVCPEPYRMNTPNASAGTVHCHIFQHFHKCHAFPSQAGQRQTMSGQAIGTESNKAKQRFVSDWY